MSFQRGTFNEPVAAAHDPVSLTIVNIQHASDAVLGIAADHGGSYEFSYNVHDDKHGGLPLCFFGASVSEADRDTAQAAVDAKAEEDDDDAEAEDDDDDDDDAAADDDVAMADAGAGAGAGAGADGQHVALAASVTDAGSRYGGVRFEVSLADAVAAYGAYEFRVLGTTTYQLEHEHAIIVARPGDTRVEDLPLLLEAPEVSPVRLHGSHDVPSLTWTSQNLNGEGFGTHWVALSVAFLQPIADVPPPSLRVAGAHVQLAFVARLYPNPAGVPPETANEAERAFVLSLIRHICPKGGPLRSFVLPQSTASLVVHINPHGPTWQYLVNLVEYETGTPFATADGIVEQHVELRRFTNLDAVQRVALLLGFLMAKISFV